MGDLEVVEDLEMGCLEGADLEGGTNLKNIFYHIFITQAFSIKMRALLLVYSMLRVYFKWEICAKI